MTRVMIVVQRLGGVGLREGGLCLHLSFRRQQDGGRWAWLVLGERPVLLASGLGSMRQEGGVTQHRGRALHRSGWEAEAACRHSTAHWSSCEAPGDGQWRRGCGGLGSPPCLHRCRSGAFPDAAACGGSRPTSCRALLCCARLHRPSRWVAPRPLPRRSPPQPGTSCAAYCASPTPTSPPQQQRTGQPWSW